MSFSRSLAVSTVLGVNWASEATKDTRAGITYCGAASSTMRASAPTTRRPACMVGRKNVMYTSPRSIRLTRGLRGVHTPGCATRYWTRPRGGA